MRNSSTLTTTLCLVGALLLAACQPAQDKGRSAPTGIAAKAMSEAQKGLGEASKELRQARTEIDAAREKLANENLSLNRNDKRHLPKAEITPAGELLIEGKAVATDPEQKTLVLAYRAALLDIVNEGMAIGMEGASIGIDAAAMALKGVLAGQSGDEIGKQVGAEAKAKLKPRVEQLCGRMPGLLAAQQALADKLPEFKPYATTDQSDVDECMDNTEWDF
ncbi:hypothetical protein [Pseudoxanthomonas putridarboris]|uniref:DUF2884 family protein n=1 Tax=Pseudoxanthomonas putridarboris TaxID=752605 RepID=A0ABU9J1L7_9GAMM